MTQYHISEDVHHQHCCENVRSYRSALISSISQKIKLHILRIFFETGRHFISGRGAITRFSTCHCLSSNEQTWQTTCLGFLQGELARAHEQVSGMYLASVSLVLFASACHSVVRGGPSVSTQHCLGIIMFYLIQYQRC